MTTHQSRFFAALFVVALAGVVGRLLAQDAPPTQQRVDIAGDWQVVTHEDQPNYGPGPELGDYAGVPLNAAARQRAEGWDSSILSQPERQTQAHPVQYVSNNRGPSRIMKIVDPVTQVHIAYGVAGGFGRADRVVWIDGRPHPSELAQHTWSGFATGKWEDGAFVMTTTHVKAGVLRRNGIYSSPYAKMVEYFFRNGPEMTVFMMIYLPAEKILIEADAYTPAAANAPPPAAVNPFWVNLNENIQKRKLDVRQIAAIHGPRVVTMADLRAVIAGPKPNAG